MENTEFSHYYTMLCLMLLVYDLSTALNYQGIQSSSTFIKPKY